jgi:hypothetical protein
VFGANAGWFSDNNFLAEGGKVYHLHYESFVSELTVEEFSSRLSARVLQNIYDGELKNRIVPTVKPY